MTWDEAVAAHEASLTIGTRVRVRPGECPWFDDNGWTDHTASVIGVSGTIAQVDTPGTHRDEHRFVVQFDEPWPLHRVAFQDKPMPRGYYAAVELIPLD